MARDSVSIRFSTDLSLVRRRLTGIGDNLKGQLEQEIMAIAEETAQQLRDTTPGHDGTGEWKSTGKLAEGWKAVPLAGTRAASRWGVTNTDPRAYAPAPRTGRTLLDLLEYGSPRQKGPGGTGSTHTITAHTNAGLRFFWTKMGRWERRMSVEHPGHAPYYFIRPAIAAAKKKQALASRRLAKVVARGLVGG